MRPRILIAAVVAVGVTLMAAPVAADTRPPNSDAFVDEDGDPTVEVDDGDEGESGYDGPPGGDLCVWHVVIADDFRHHVYAIDGTVQYSESGRWLQKVCPGLGPVEVGGRFVVPEGGLVDVQALSQQARASIGISGPVIRTSPEANGRLYVRVPTWLWIDDAWWHTYSATASAGRVNATAVATPVSTSWAFGDGGLISCSGPGIEWRAGLPGGATDCSHTFTTSSAGRPGGTFSLSATVTLDVTWTSNIGSGGSLSSVRRSSSEAVEVGEIQAIGTGG